LEFHQVFAFLLGGLPNYIIAMNSHVAKSLSNHPDDEDIIDRVPTGKYALFLFVTGLVAVTSILPLMQVNYFALTRSLLCLHPIDYSFLSKILKK